MPATKTPQQSIIWQPTPKALMLEAGTIQIILASLKRSAEDISHFHSLLNADERARAARYKFDIHRHQFIISQGILRTLLARVAPLQAQGIRANAIEFIFNDHRKPALASSCTLPDFAFNLSHSGELALYAFTLAPTVGIDIEIIRPDFGGVAIAKRFFADAEVKALLASPKQEQARNFFRIWTAKEAFIKAVGEGLSYPLADFNVSFQPNDQMQLTSIKGSTKAAKTWHMHAFCPQAGYISCLTMPHTITHLATYTI